MKSLPEDQAKPPLPDFIPGPSGRLFTLSFPAQGEHQGTFIYIPPFAEEANKSRRMAALQARALAARGYRVVLLDLFGTGDSEGDFGDASWSLWKQDIEALLTHVDRSRPLNFWGLRMGCLLIADFLRERQSLEIDTCLFWHPVMLGQQLVTQFLRLEMANSLMAEEKVTPKMIRERLQRGEMVEIAGYRLRPDLVNELDQLKLADCGNHCRALHWLELVNQEGRGISPVAAKVLQQWRQPGNIVEEHTVVGDSFWSTQEITTVPALLQRSLNCVMGPD